MPRSKSQSRATLARLIVLGVVGWALVALRPRPLAEVEEDAAAPVFAAPPAPFDVETATEPVVRRRARSRQRRFATSLAFATLFFSGAALSAGAGDAIVGALEGETTTAETTTTVPTSETDPGSGGDAAPDEAPPEPETEIPPADSPPAPEPAPAPEPPADATEPPADGEQPPAEDATPPANEAPAPGPAPAPAPGAPPAAPSSGETPSGGKTPAQAPSAAPPAAQGSNGPPLLEPHAHEDDAGSRAVDPEAEALGGFATVWLHRSLPDPTPPAKRLAPEFAQLLREEAARARIGWSTLLGALRADGRGGRYPAGRTLLRSMATRLSARSAAGEWQAFLGLRGRTAYADRAQALARYNRAVGLKALVVGLDASKGKLEERVLADRRLDIYGGGRSDILAGRIDVRVLVLIRYLAEAHGQVTVSSLHSGHRIYSRPGVVSAHTYGLAVDIAALGGRPIMGNSQPGGLTESAVRNILFLPAELRPQQVISLLGLGGPSFPLANHADHIHAGY